MRKVGVIGCGVVGGAVAKALEVRGKGLVRVFKFDKMKKEFDDVPLIFGSEIIFVCVPTPTNDGIQDLTCLDEVFALLKSVNYQGIICVKSTVLPGTCEAMGEKWGMNKVVHNPEFLTEANPFQDFMDQPAVLVGSRNMEAAIEVGELYYELRFQKIRVYHDAKVTELAKYMRNNYLASKVGFANEQKEYADVIGVPFDIARDAMLEIGSIERGHFTVAPNGQKGFGGMCFPKDTQAQATHAREIGCPLLQLEATIHANNVRRAA